MSEDLTAKFGRAAKEVAQLSEAPDQHAMLALYALFKQATVGDYTQGKKPGMLDVVGKFKYEAWKQREGMSQEEAMQKYVTLVEKLKADDVAKQ